MQLFCRFLGYKYTFKLSSVSHLNSESILDLWGIGLSGGLKFGLSLWGSMNLRVILRYGGLNNLSRVWGILDCSQTGTRRGHYPAGPHILQSWQRPSLLWFWGPSFIIVVYGPSWLLLLKLQASIF